MARIWCHLTTRTVLIEWQPILIRVVSVFTVRVRYAEMSLNAQKLNKLLHSIWVNRAPCGSPGENGPPRICQYPLATRVSIICWHFLTFFWVFHNFVTLPNRIGWKNAKVLWSLHSRLPHRVAELQRAQAHTTNILMECEFVLSYMADHL